jgi:hypothetical protein
MEEEIRLHEFCLNLFVIQWQIFSSPPPCLHVTTNPVTQDAYCQIQAVLTDSVCSPFKKTYQVVSHMQRLALPPGNTPGTHFC